MNSQQQSVSTYTPKKILRGANLYCAQSILVAELDRSVSSQTADENFVERVFTVLNSYRPKHVESQLAEMPPLPEETNSPRTVANTFCSLAIILQRWCGLPVEFSKVLETAEESQAMHVVVECRLEQLATAAARPRTLASRPARPPNRKSAAIMTRDL